MATMLSEPQLLSSISSERAWMGGGLEGEANLESILKADSSLRMLAALSTKWLPPREACCMAELYLPSAAADSHLSTCQHVVLASMAQTTQARQHTNTATAVTMLSSVLSKIMLVHQISS